MIVLDEVQPGDTVTIRSGDSVATGPVGTDTAGQLFVVAFNGQAVVFARPKANGQLGLIPRPGVHVTEHQGRLL